MQILVIDGQGGGIGAQVVSMIREKFPRALITAVGTNTVATGTMIKAGAMHAATGENAVMVGCRRADVIIGPIGIVIADSLHGEVTPAMAVAVGQSDAKRILIPGSHCDSIIAGMGDVPLYRLLQSAVETLSHWLEG